ncbi:MAG: flhA, partial [Cyanobacteria bacterium RYN_339]|nr:flhA [Cyanobacteria bacterium RYN_339]
MTHAHPITRLVTRYGQAHGMYLYGEYCLLVTLGFDAFRRRHTDTQLQALAAQLAPLALWPEVAPEHVGQRPEGIGILEGVAASLTRPPLMLGLGIDLYFACLAWAGSQDGVQGDPAAWFEPSRLVLARQLGFMPPPLVVQLDDGVAAHGYRLYAWGEAVAEGEAYPGLDLMLGPPDAAPPPLPYAWSRDPAGPGWITWLPIGPGATPPAALERLHWIVAMNRHVTAVLPAHATKLLTAPVVHGLLQDAEALGYDHELERYVSIPELRLVFQALLKQGLRVEAGPALERMLTTVLADLAGREVTPPELEKIARQLPVFGTQRLVGIVRKGMGLPEQPPPTMKWPPGPGPEPIASPPVAPDH